jgi:hypothetical protein
VRICLADDDGGYKRAEEIVRSSSWRGEEQRPQLPLLVISARQCGLNVALSSSSGLLEHDLPKLRAERPEAELSLVALIPDGSRWRGYQARYAHAARDIWWEITNLLRPRTNDRPFELTVGQKLPALGLAPSLPSVEAEKQLAELVEHLREQRYWDNERGIPLAEPGEIEFRSACVAVPPGSDGSAELAELRARLAEAEA